MGATGDGKERRQHRRYKLWIPAQIETDEGVQPAVGHDVSQKGLLLVTRGSQLAPGQQIRLSIQLPDEESERKLAATVVRCSSNEADPEGLWPLRIAVELDEADPELEERLAELLDELPPSSGGPRE